MLNFSAEKQVTYKKIRVLSDISSETVDLEDEEYYLQMTEKRATTLDCYNQSVDHLSVRKNENECSCYKLPEKCILYILSMLGPKTKIQCSAEKKCDNGTSSLFSL